MPPRSEAGNGPFYTRFLLGKALSILLRNGIYRGAYLTSWLDKQLTAHGTTYRTGTFADLEYEDPDPARTLSIEQRSRLVVTASDLTAGRLRLMPRDGDTFGLAPEQLRVADAVRASMSIPIVFRPAT